MEMLLGGRGSVRPVGGHGSTATKGGRGAVRLRGWSLREGWSWLRRWSLQSIRSQPKGGRYIMGGRDHGLVSVQWEVCARKEVVGVLTVRSRSRERIDYTAVIKRNKCVTVLSQSDEPAEKPKEEPKDHPRENKAT